MSGGSMKTSEKQQISQGSISHRILTAAGIIICILLALLLVCNLIIIVRGTLSPEKPPSVLGITPMAVLSGSMSGTQEGHIEAGDLIFAVRTDPETLKEGDIISFMESGTAVTHRITEVTADEDGNPVFTTKGDANETEDTESVTSDQIIGIFLWRIPKAGDFALFLQQPLGMLLFIGVPLLAFIIYDIIRRQRYALRVKKKSGEMETELVRFRALTEAGKEEQPVPDTHSGCGSDTVSAEYCDGQKEMP